MGFLRRPTFYYQFDREQFYGGGHNWRPGYFDYDRDGFGPAARTEEELLSHLLPFLQGGCRCDPKYLARMQLAMPYPDDQACLRVFESIQRVGCGPKHGQIENRSV
jgi:CDP-glycerol glycerophosphotransferase (TagB/SpsB family)